MSQTIPEGGGELSELPAQLDTAADRSVIPWSVVESLRLPQVDELPVLGFGGHLSSVPTFLVVLEVRGCAPLTLEVYASHEEPYTLLGRDVLNTFRLILDGPQMTLEVETGSSG